MSYTFALSYMLFSAVSSYLICRLLVSISHRHALFDTVTTRSSHNMPTPRIGGISFVVLNSILLSYLISRFSNPQDNLTYCLLLIPPILVALISFAEDLTSKVSRKIRLTGHLVAAILTVVLLNNYLTLALPLFVYFLVIVAVTWAINLYNFMDGIDGIAVTEGLFIIITLSIMAFCQHHDSWGAILICLSGSLIGFLIINWQPARIFMGDVGSTYLGILISIILIISVAKGIVNVWGAIILAGTFLVDATWTLLFRLLSGQPWYKPHRSHAYQILSRKLASHSKISAGNACVNIFWLLPLCLLAESMPNYGHFFTIIALFPLALLDMLSKAGRADSN